MMMNRVINRMVIRIFRMMSELGHDCGLGQNWMMNNDDEQSDKQNGDQDIQDDVRTGT